MFNVERSCTLSNGVSIPSIGFGTWKINNGMAYDSVLNAIRTGYKAIDSASIYGNEEEVGRAIIDSHIDRRNLFITGKVWNDDQGYDSTINAFNLSREKMKLDYFDLYLIHWPVPKKYRDNYQEMNLETWKAMEYLYRTKKVRAIGVSNFQTHHLKELIGKNITIKPMVNQIELHPLYFDDDTVEFCQKNNITVEAYSPLMRGMNLERQELKELAFKYNKTTAQICLRWSMQRGIIPLPKSTNMLRMKSNLDVYGFNIDDEDMRKINAMADPNGKIGSYPDNISF